MAGSSIPPGKQTRFGGYGFAWWVVALLFAGSVLNYMDRAVLGVVMPQIRKDLSLTNTEYGFAVNAFLTTYAIFYVLGGRVADWLGCRRSFLWTVLFWSVSNMLHAFVQGLRTLCLFRALLGAGEGAFYPAAIRGATEWFAPQDRAKAVGLLLSGISVGTLLTPPVAAWITIHYGWRFAFLATGAAGLPLIPAWLLLHRRIQAIYGARDPAPASRSAQPIEAAAEVTVPLTGVLRRRKYWYVLAARAVSDAAWYFYLFWMPGYFQEVRGFGPEQVGKLLWIPYFSAGLGALGGAWLSSALIRRGVGLDLARKSILFASAFLGFSGASAYFMPSHMFALALVSLALFGHQSWSSNIHTVITEICPPEHVAMLYGITGAAGTLLGALSQPLVGRVIDLHGYAAAFVAAGSAYLLAAGLLLGMGQIERIRR